MPRESPPLLRKTKNTFRTLTSELDIANDLFGVGNFLAAEHFGHSSKIGGTIVFYFQRLPSRRVLALIILATGTPVASANTNWQANPSAPDDWFDNFAWSAGVPSSNQSAYISDGGTASITYGSAAAEGLYLGFNNSNNNGSAGTVVMSAGMLTCSNNYIYDGYDGVGLFAQSGGEVTAQDLYLGYEYPSNGVYELSGTGSLSTAYENIGYQSNNTGVGQFIQTGGTHTVSSQLTVYNGSYSMSGNSTLSAAQLELAAGSTAANSTFTQVGGVVTLTGSLGSYIGYNNNYSGLAIYSMSSGAVLTNVGNFSSPFYVAYYGTGIFSQTDSTCNFGISPLYLAYNSTSNATYTLAGNSQLYANNEYVGYSNTGRANFTQTGGTNDLGTAGLYLGGISSYAMSGTSYLYSGNQYVGYGSDNSSSNFIQSGGLNDLGTYTLTVGDQYNETASYSLSATGMLTAGIEYIGSVGSAIFAQSGGTNIIAASNQINAGVLGVGYTSGQSQNGEYLLSGGLITARTEVIGGTSTNVPSLGLFNQSGGSNLVNNFTVNVAGRYNLLAGLFQVTSSFINSGTFDLQNPAAAGLGGTNSLTLAPLAISGTGNLMVEQNAALYAGSIKQSSLIIGGKIQIAPGSLVSKINSLNITTGTLDITNNALIIDYPSAGPSPLSAVRGYLHSGYVSNETGSGIVSSTAVGDWAVGIGYAEASALGVTTFGSMIVDSTAILIRYTWTGDANLDGIVNAADLAMISSNGSTWSTGDFNYDGVVNADDYALFDLGLAEGGSTVIPFPEPAWLGCLMVLFLGRRQGCVSIGPEIT
jgi:hypothetical protein